MIVILHYHIKLLVPHITIFRAQEKSSIANLSSNRSIVINKADKGNNIIIQNTADYIKEIYLQLHNAKYYRVNLNSREREMSDVPMVKAIHVT